MYDMITQQPVLQFIKRPGKEEKTTAPPPKKKYLKGYDTFFSAKFLNMSNFVRVSVLCYRSSLFSVLFARHYHVISDP